MQSQSSHGRAVPEEQPGTSVLVREVDEFTFLATDIVGSSELHRRYPDEMLAAMDRHDQILEAAITRHGGAIFKHTGDGVIAKFQNPTDAVAAARDIQIDMRANEWAATGRPRLRTAVHIGLARPRGGDFFGPALSVLHRMEDAANADQILVSDAILAQLGSDAQARFKDLGEHHFKGVERIRVYQLLGDGLADTFAAIAGKRETSHGNLPAELSTFVGRETEIDGLRRLIDTSRVTTLVGPAGIGKTRLAVETLRASLPDFPDGVWMLHLSALERETVLWPVLAQALSIEPQPGADPRLQVLDRLRESRTLLLFDNCEHLIEPVCDLALDLCSSCSAVNIVSTSRQVLGLQGEALFEVAALDGTRQDRDGMTNPVRLFVDRAQLVRHQFVPSSKDLHTIAQICDSLDNIPLAIELAAGQMRRSTLERIAHQALNPLDLAPGRVRRGGSRQQTLRRALEWSYSLIDDTSRQVLDRLSVFSGPFHEEQAVAVCAMDRQDDVDTLDAIDDLIDASLLSARLDGSRRVRMLRSVQAFGRERLSADGGLLDVEHRHGEVFAERIADLAEAFRGDGEAEAASAIQEDMDNLRSAFDRALKNDLSLAARLAAPLALHNYYHRGSETAFWPGRVMAEPGADDLPEAPILLAAAASHTFHERGRPEEAQVLLDRGFAAEARGPGTSRGWLAHVSGQIAFWSRRIRDFFMWHEKVMEASRASGDTALAIIDLSAAVFVKAAVDDRPAVERMQKDLQSLAAEIQQPSLIGYLHFALGGIAGMDDTDQAVVELRTAMEWARIGGNVLGAQRTNRIMADYLADRADPDRALDILADALGQLPEQGATIYVWTTIAQMLLPLAKSGRFTAVATLAGALDQAPVTFGRTAKSALAMSQEAMERAEWDALMRKGHPFDQDDARRFALNAIRTPPDGQKP